MAWVCDHIVGLWLWHGYVTVVCGNVAPFLGPGPRRGNVAPALRVKHNSTLGVSIPVLRLGTQLGEG